MRARLLSLLLLAAACKESGGAPCGIIAVAGPLSLLNQFAVPEQTLTQPPAQLPERIAVRLVAGPVVSAIVGRRRSADGADSALVIGVEGTIPATARPQFGVLVVAPSGTARGVMLYENEPVRGAPELGTVSIGATSLPLIGIKVDAERFEDARCPFFPDSVLR